MKWPEEIPVGPFDVNLVVVPASEFDPEDNEEFDGSQTAAMYNGDMLVIGYREDTDDVESVRLTYRTDNDICHEVIHSWEDIVLAHGVHLSESETQGLANALHQLLLAVLKANGVEDDGLEISRAKSSR